MPEPEIHMPESFYDWLAECPVHWHRTEANADQLSYTFIVPPTEESDNDD